MNFEWDVLKAQLNLMKHGVSFDEVNSVFQDSNSFDLEDRKHSNENERRYRRIGRSGHSKILIVVYTLRRKSVDEQEIIRVISARSRATPPLRDIPDEEIDFSDIPELADDELSRMRRVGPGRPPLGDAPRKMISIKLDQDLLANLKREAEKTGKLYQSLIHEILTRHVRRKAAQPHPKTGG